MRKNKVLLLGAEENPSLPIIQSLTRAGLEVHVASHRKLCVGFFSRFPKKRLVYPSPYTHETDFLAQVLSYIKRENYDVTFVAGDRVTDVIAKNKDLLEPHTRIPLVDFDRYSLCRDKSKTMKMAQSLNIPMPKTYFPEEEGIQSVADSVEFPIVLKPNTSDGARGISYPQSKKELFEQYHLTIEQYGPCHIQEFIPQTGMQYKAEFVFDQNGEMIGRCVYNKLRYYPVTGGSSTLNSTVIREDILSHGERILKEMNWYGMGDCDFIEDPRDGVPKLMEINPRFTRSIKICVLAGVDFPYLLYRVAMSKPVDSVKDYRDRVFMRYLAGDIMWFIKSPERFTARPSFFNLGLGTVNEEIFSVKDPAPYLGFLLGKVSNKLNRIESQYSLKSRTEVAQVVGKY